MLKFTRRTFLQVMLCLLCFSSVQAEEEKLPVAGEVITKSQSSPKFTFDPHPSIDGIFTPRPVEHNDEEIYFSADEIQNDSNTSDITAIGDVYIIRDDVTLKADKVIYNQDADTVTARGNVLLVDRSNNVLYADEIVLKDKMSRGTMRKLKVVMRDESLIWAKKFKRLDNDDKVMYGATYTPCDCCLDNSCQKEPLWKISASKITQDLKNKNIYYRNAFLRVKNVPVFYMPFLSHPDPSVKRRSGFLFPKYGSSNFLESYFQPNYFWAINDHSDMVLSPYFSSKHGFIPQATYRGYAQKGEVSLEGSVFKDKDMGKGRDDKVRGNLFVTGRYELNENWLAKMDWKYVSDIQYMRDMSLSGKTDPWLISNVGLQYFKDRDYASVDAYYFRTNSYYTHISPQRDRYDGAYVLPMLDYEKYNQLTDFGLYARNSISYATIMHDNEEASSNRATMINELVLPYTSRFGEKIKLVGSVKSDLYYVDDYSNTRGENITGSTGRIFPQLGLEWKLPFIKASEESRQIIEPVIVGVFAPNAGNERNRIPNEDSQNAFLDDVNVLDLDRYAGYDRNDTGSRISYGINWSSYGNILGRTQAFIAQSYEFDDKDSFSQSIGEDSHFSDYVGHVYASPNEYLDLNYRFKLDKNNLEMKYNELGASFGPQMLRGYISYIYLQDNEDDAMRRTHKRHELYTALNAKLTRDWSLRVYNRQDLSKEKSYSVEHGGSLIYDDECLSLAGNIRRYGSHVEGVDNDYEFSITFLLKTIGGIASK